MFYTYALKNIVLRKMSEYLGEFGWGYGYGYGYGYG